MASDFGRLCVWTKCACLPSVYVYFVDHFLTNDVCVPNWNQVTTTRHNYFGGFQASVPYATPWLLYCCFFLQARCCGAKNYRDYENVTSWARKHPEQIIPEVCCMIDQKKYDLLGTISPVDRNCTIAPTKENSHIDKVLNH